MSDLMKNMRRAGLIAPLVAVALLVGACDSADDEDRVSFVGTWNVTQLVINSQNLTTLLFGQAGIEALGATFEDGGALEIFVVREGERVATSGTYSATRNELVLNSESFQAPLELTYTAQNDDTIVLTSDDPSILSELSGVDVSQLPFQVERIDITIRRQ